MDSYVLKTFGKILKSNHDTMRTELGRGTDVMRVYERVLDSLDCSVDLYGQYALVTSYGGIELSEENVGEIVSAVASNLYVPKKNVILKEKAKGKEFQSLYAEPVAVKVREDGLVFNAELALKADTGFYIDNYRAHLLVRELSRDIPVLNLFSYTGGYSVNAAAGGAVRVVSVDTSASAQEAARLNMKENGFEGDCFEFVRDDCAHYIGNCPEKSFGLIIFDAPTFSNAHGGRRENFDIQKDHAESLLKCRKLLRKDGVILFRTAMQNFVLASDRLDCYKIRTYTAEMRAPGFTRKSLIAKTFVLKPYEGDEKRKSIEKKLKLNIRRPAGEETVGFGDVDRDFGGSREYTGDNGGYSRDDCGFGRDDEGRSDRGGLGRGGHDGFDSDRGGLGRGGHDGFDSDRGGLGRDGGDRREGHGAYSHGDRGGRGFGRGDGDRRPREGYGGRDFSREGFGRGGRDDRERDGFGRRSDRGGFGRGGRDDEGRSDRGGFRRGGHDSFGSDRGGFRRDGGDRREGHGAYSHGDRGGRGFGREGFGRGERDGDGRRDGFGRSGDRRGERPRDGFRRGGRDDEGRSDRGGFRRGGHDSFGSDRGGLGRGEGRREDRGGRDFGREGFGRDGERRFGDGFARGAKKAPPLRPMVKDGDGHDGKPDGGEES